MMDATPTTIRVVPLEDDGSDGSVRECAYMATARRLASELAVKNGRPVRIDRIGKDGTVRPTLLLDAEGVPSRPPGSRGTAYGDCKRSRGQACFCLTCRAERRDAR